MTEIFGPYELTELLGRGGMGEVWRAVDTRKSRVVAVKRLPSEMSGEREFEDRFRREAHAAARLNDPHVIPIHDFGEIDGRLYLDMRLVQGRDLAAVIAANGALVPSRAVSVIEQVASALDAAHDEGLVHRDVKPSNILLTPSKRTVGPQDFVYLIDFGIATGAALGTRLTQTGMAIGTAAYMAPERFAEGIDTDPRIDVYALGCVLHEMLTGQAPFAGRDFASLMYQHLNTAPPQPSQQVTTLPPAFDAVVATALTKDREARFARAGDLADAARRALATPTSQRRTPTVVPPRPPTARPPQDRRVTPVDRPVTRSAPLPPSAVPVPWSPAPSVPARVAVMPPPMPAPTGSNGWRVTGAITAIVISILFGILCLAGTITEFSRCSSAAAACVAGTSALLGMVSAGAGFGVSIAALTTVARRTRRRIGLAWSMVGASFVLFVLAAVLSV